MKKVLAFGEILLRLSPPGYQTLTQAQQLDCQFGGAELNVLATLTQLGYPTSLITAIPDNAIGAMTEHFLFARQIGQEFVVKKGSRLGLYYYQKGFSLRSSQVTYDRAHSAFDESKPEDYPLEALFHDAQWFHVSGITVALNPTIYALTLDLMRQAKARGLKVSFDLNYRASLWPSFQAAREALSPFVALADICIGLEPLTLLDEQGLDLKDQFALNPPYQEETLLKVLPILTDRYGLETVAFTQREMSHGNDYYLKAYLYHQGQLYSTAREPIQVLDRVGTGDAFTAGIIYGFLEGQAPQVVLDMGLASFKFKHTIEGDVNIMSRHDITQFLSPSGQDIHR